MSSWLLCLKGLCLFAASILAFCVPVQADVAPPVEIQMPLDTKQAVPGQEYTGVFEVRVFKAGTLAKFELAGEGWVILSADVPASPTAVEPGVLKVPFRAVPADANKPIGLSLTWNGRRVRKAYEIGPSYFGRGGRSYSSACIEREGAEEPQGAGQTGESDGARGTSGTGDRRTLSFTGRIVYNRQCRDMRDPNTGDPPDGDCDDPWDLPRRIVGVDSIYVEIWDSDTIGHETIWSGYTDENGYFVTPQIDWDDGDDDPDLVLYYETNSPVVDVTDNSIAESTYSFESDEITDFTGSHHDFCWHAPADSALYPPLHIYNSVVRTHRFITTRSDLEPPKVQVEWPDDAEPTSWYEPGPVEIHMNPMHNWQEDVVSHEYGHHVMHSYGDPPEPDYCNGYCDPDPPDDCGHCWWCPETDHDAWNEGLPNWLADVVTRSYSLDYLFDDGSHFYPLYTCDLEFEALQNTDCLGQPKEPLTTEGFVGMLLRDIEDDMQDPPLLDDGPTDSLCLGAGCILETQAFTDPTTVLEFMTAFRARYPQWSDDLWPTARNVAPEYVVSYGPDSTPPGAVAVCDSPTHPLGGWGALPCITIEWQPAPDEGRGACHYSLRWGQDPGGTEPDTEDEDDKISWSGCYLSTSGGPFNFGDWYVSIRAGDCSGNWSTTWSTFGPFTVGECNGNGILDVCEITCNLSTLGLPCNPGFNYCLIFWPDTCGGVPDCNGNLVPDECDIASGFSEDCNLNAIPDECENMFHWAGASGSWHVAGNWLEGTTPTTDSEVCIDVPSSQTVTYSNGTLQIATLACSESLAIESAIGSRALAITAPSFVLGDLRLANNDSVLQVDDRLDVGGLFEWTGSNSSSSAKLKGAGVTYVNGGSQITDIVHLDQHRLVLDGNSTSVTTTGRVDFAGPAVFEIRPGSTYEHRGSGYILNGWFSDRFVNGGTLIKSADPGSSTIYMFTENNGLIHVQAGTLKFYLYGSSSGDFLGDPGTTLHFVDGGFEFYNGSTLTAHNVILNGNGGGWNCVYGGATWNVTGTTTVQGGQTTFDSAADVVSYGSSFYVPAGTVNFNAVLGEPIVFETFSVGPGGNAIASFNSGDPVQVTNLIIGPGSIAGPSQITVSGLLTWNSSGSIVGPGTINADGGLLVTAGSGERTLNNRILDNAATATFQGCLSLSGTATFNNLPGAVMDIQFDSGASVINWGTLSNAGTLVKSAGTGTSHINAKVTNTGTVEVQTGTLQFNTNYGNFYTQAAGQTVLNNGNLAVPSPGVLQMNGGLLTGTGTVSGCVVNAGGTLAPGLSIGQLTIAGTYCYYQQAGGTLEIEIGGTAPGAFDKLVGTGLVVLTGDLDVTFVSPFEPQHGDTFVVVTAGGAGLSVAFDSVTVHNLPPTMILDVDADYGLGTVTLRVFGGETQGDLNCDGAVNVADTPHFVQALADPVGYDADHDGDPHPVCDRTRADMNDDDLLDGLDIQPFANLLLAP